MAAFLKIDFCTVLQRRKRAVAYQGHRGAGDLPVIGDWAVFTDRGAEAFVAIMEGNEVAHAKTAPCSRSTGNLFRRTSATSAYLNPNITDTSRRWRPMRSPRPES